MSDCPTCGLPEEIVYTAGPFPSSDGPVDVAAMRCLGGHRRDVAIPAHSVD